MSVYLDYNSSTPINRRVLAKMIEIYEGFYGNADSRTHDFGTAASVIVETARLEVAKLLSVTKDEVFFTSGATESNNIAIQGLTEYAEKTRKRHIISSSIEHKAVLNTIKHMQTLGYDVDFVDPEQDGRVSAKKILDLVREDTLLVCLMHVNNETGIIQPIQSVGSGLKGSGVLFHIDATQSVGKLVDDLRAASYSSLSLSAHKIGGPQGVGALILKKQGYRRSPVRGIMFGGQQEHGIRPGTIPVALVAGLGESCKIARESYRDSLEKCAIIKANLVEMLDKSGVTYTLNGDQNFCIPSTMNICFAGVSSEALMLTTKQYCAISNGSACNSKSYEPSYVLRAMGIPDEKIECSVRVSWGPLEDMNLVKDSFMELVKIVQALV